MLASSAPARSSVLPVCLAIGSALVLAACVSANGSPSPSVAGPTPGSPGSSTGTPGPTTPGLPAGFPLMRGMVADDPLPTESGLIGRWTTEANGAEVFAFLKDALPAAGFRVDLLGPGDTVAVIRFTPPRGQQLQIDLGQAGADTFMELRLPRD